MGYLIASMATDRAGQNWGQVTDVDLKQVRRLRLKLWLHITVPSVEQSSCVVLLSTGCLHDNHRKHLKISYPSSVFIFLNRMLNDVLFSHCYYCPGVLSIILKSWFHFAGCKPDVFLINELSGLNFLKRAVSNICVKHGMQECIV